MKRGSTEVLLFDFDGTLVDMRGINWFEVRKIIAKTYIKYGIPAEVTARYPFPFLMYIRMYEEKIDFSEPELNKIQKKISKIIERYEMRAVKNTVPVLGAVKTLQELKKNGIKVGVISLNGERPVIKILRKLGMKSYVDVLFTRDSPGRPKPFPDQIRLILRKLRSKAKNAILVGDTPIDMIAAKKAKVRGVGFSGGMYIEEELSQAGAWKVIKKLPEVLNLKG